MAGLVCDICGGGLMSDGDGEIFICDSCGTKYPKERVKKMFIELSAPVQVEGIASISNIYKRAMIFLEQSDFEQANMYFDKILDIDAEYAPAYTGKLTARAQLRKESDLVNLLNPLTNHNEFILAVRYADNEYRTVLLEYNQKILDRIEQQRLANEVQYQKAEELLASGQKIQALALYSKLGDYKDAITKTLIARAVKFGSYVWRILDAQDGKMLLITEDIIEERPFNSELANVTWANCTLRMYLNGDFYKRFNQVEKSRIMEVFNATPDNLIYGTDGGNDTTDKIFLLSIEEASKYFKDDTDRVANYQGKSSSWWLRSPGGSGGFAAYVYRNGDVGSNSNRITDHLGVRPALWLNLESNISQSISLQTNPKLDADGGRENLEEERHLAQQCQDQSQQWSQQGLCCYCGGKLSWIANKCKSCGKQN